MLSLKTKSSGFTLIEIIVVIGIMVVLSGTAITTLTSFFNTSQLNTTTDNVVNSLERARNNSANRLNDSSWGVYLDDGVNSYTFFKGATYATRDTGADEVTSFTANMDLESVSLNGGGSEIVFGKTTGNTDDYGSFVVNEANTDFSFTVTVNSLGVIDVN